MPEVRILKYELLNINAKDKRLTYNDEEHKYYIDGNAVELSVSQFVHTLFKPFEQNIVINNILKSKKMNDPNYEYFGMNATQIKQSWVDRAELGVKLHYDIESFYNDENYDNVSIEFQYFINFFRDFSYLQVYRSEWKIFCEKVDIAGTIDMLFKDLSGNFIIFDWKRSKEIKKPDPNNRFNEFSLNPFLSDMIQCNFNEYSIQLNMYKYILKEEYGIIVKDMYLCVLHPINSNYVLHRVSDMSEKINLIMNERIKMKNQKV